MGDINETQRQLLIHIVELGGGQGPVKLQRAHRLSAEVLDCGGLIELDPDRLLASVTDLGWAWLAQDDPEAPVQPNRCGHNEPGGLPGSYGQEVGVGVGGPFCALCCEPTQKMELRESTRTVATLSQDWTQMTGAAGTLFGHVVDTTLPAGTHGQRTLRILDIHGCLWWAKASTPGRMYINLYKDQKAERADLPEPWRSQARGDAEEYRRRDRNAEQRTMAQERLRRRGTTS